MTEASRSSALEESIFCLLVPASDIASSEASSIDVGGQRWQVVAHGAVPSPAEAPEFICVSYSWGTERTRSVFDPEQYMSPRALPVLEAAITAARLPAIWLDAACMPSHEPAHRLCLQNMGAIYAAATGVVVVLSPSASTLLNKVRRQEALGPEDLRVLEAEEWVRRAWTYQEIVNSKIIRFVAEGKRSEAVIGDKLLNAVGRAITQYQKAEQVDAYQFRGQHPHLDALETVIDDWLRSDFAKRSAYRIMSAMVTRTVIDPDDYFYAMVGAITSAPSADSDRAALSAPEYFMQVCEQEGDFSFAYSNAPRGSHISGWRPRPGPLPPIVPWPSVGERQSGELCSASLRLHNMARARLGRPGEAAQTFIHDWLRKTVRCPLPPDPRDAVRQTLYRAGFTGCGQYLETTSGLFFPQNPLSDAGSCEMFVATDISFNFGAPGLIINPNESGTAQLCNIGVFVGPLPRDTESISIR